MLRVRRLICCLLAALATGGAPLRAGAADQPPFARPNILLILADDLGYADLGCQGADDVRTPRIDALAAGGIRCTAGYVTAPQCSPSRAGLLSGRYQQRFGHEGNPNFPQMLLEGGRTIADYLHAAGYATGHFGKWHLGFERPSDAPPELRTADDLAMPRQHGFDESFGYADYTAAARAGSDIPPAAHAYDDRVFARRASDFIAQHVERRWFVYLALHAPHTQHVDFGNHRPRFSTAGPNRQPVLAVMAQQDDAVGIVLDRLESLDLTSDTLIWYISDNGGTQRSAGETQHPTGSRNLPFSGDKGTCFEGGIRVPWLVHWRGHLPDGLSYDRPVSTLDVLPTVLAAAGIAPPLDVALDGVNLLPLLTHQRTGEPHEALFWRWRAEQAVRMGDWKLVRGKEHRAWRLIDLAHDPQELHDLAASDPQRAAAMQARFDAWNATLLPPGPSYRDPVEASP